jgi:hypothetical protein
MGHAPLLVLVVASRGGEPLLEFRVEVVDRVVAHVGVVVWGDSEWFEVGEDADVWNLWAPRPRPRSSSGSSPLRVRTEFQFQFQFRFQFHFAANLWAAHWIERLRRTGTARRVKRKNYACR